MPQPGAFAEPDRDLLELAFEVPTPVRDRTGAFRPEWLLQHFAYQNIALLKALLPHLTSLGLFQVSDVLAGVSTIGSLLSTADPVAAWRAAATLLLALRAAGAPLRSEVLAHLSASHSAISRAGALARKQLWDAYTTTDAEERAWAVSGAYERTSEGPLRQYAAVLLALDRQQWGPVPMLSALADRMASAGGELTDLATAALLPALRNAEAHENLEWDGFTDEYVLERTRLPVAQVERAIAAASSFAAGCSAAETAFRSILAAPYSNWLPMPGEQGRMPDRLRVEAFFGANPIRLLRSSISGPVVQFDVDPLHEEDVNPCFQALTLARKLLPRAVRFEVRVPASLGPVIEVEASALDLTIPVWTVAVSGLDRIPFSTFLPANLAARSRYEMPSAARRAVAWIAVDDLLDAVDGNFLVPAAERRSTLLKRLEVVEAAVQMTQEGLMEHDVRLRSLGNSAAALR